MANHALICQLYYLIPGVGWFEGGGGGDPGGAYCMGNSIKKDIVHETSPLLVSNSARKTKMSSKISRARSWIVDHQDPIGT